MFKQILGKLPRKPSKSSEGRESSTQSVLSLNTSAASRSNNLDNDSHLGNNHGTKPVQVVSPRLNSNAFEALPAFRDVPALRSRICSSKSLTCVVWCLTLLTRLRI